MIQQLMDAANEQTRKVNELRAEVARLRAALEKIGERVGGWLAEPDAPDTGDLVLLATEIEWTLGAQDADA